MEATGNIGVFKGISDNTYINCIYNLYTDINAKERRTLHACVNFTGHISFFSSNTRSSIYASPLTHKFKYN